MIRCVADTCLNLLCNRKGVQTNCDCCGISIGTFKIKMCSFQKDGTQQGWQVGNLHCLAAQLPLTTFHFNQLLVLLFSLFSPNSPHSQQFNTE